MSKKEKMPTKNIYIGELNNNSHVEDRGTYWVAKDPVDGKFGVVNWEGNQAIRHQARLRQLAQLTTKRNEKARDDKMYKKGYRYKLIPVSGSFEPLYIKTSMQAGPLMRELYPNERFSSVVLKEPT